MEVLVVHPALAVVLGILFVAIFAFSFIAGRRGWFYWHAVDANALVGSRVGYPRLLLAARLAIMTYALAILVYALSVPNGPTQLVFFTLWNFILLAGYFACILGFGAWMRWVGRSHVIVERTLWVLFELNAAMVLLVDVVLWTVLYPQLKSDGYADVVLNVVSYHMHGVNAAYMAVELALNALPVVPAHAVFAVLWGLSYGAFSWARYIHSGTWPYFFLDTKDAIAAAWYGGVSLLHVLFFLFVCGCDRAKGLCLGRREAAREAARVAEHRLLIQDGGCEDDDDVT